MAFSTSSRRSIARNGRSAQIEIGAFSSTKNLFCRTGGWQFALDPDGGQCIAAVEHKENEYLREKMDLIRSALRRRLRLITFCSLAFGFPLDKNEMGLKPAELGLKLDVK